ncbi:glycerol-3-phosphate dehydrogenase/oxidase [Schumannella soli]|uniref:Glycerol-3-phosphate dehydrogenase/oxidase n=1 Tax=Schumannella soli TaxID=2590779 RepID=A0A506XQB9_9MICO|nr:glycerol-3-phosphate dehydrogenase/oxidase [Schumannella soli]TPW74861.1 glycerol-3-phosphate dehydrogenase/oxidase [Schumannella soli]
MNAFARAGAERLTAETYDLLVVGGGINGVAIARDAALRGLRTALIERGDFAIGTSSWNSRLIHGGLRYLEHGEIPLVYESLHDRERLLRIAPHLVQPLEFVVPLYQHNHLPGWMFRAGVLLFDVLSTGKSVPGHRGMNLKSVAAELPGLSRDGLGGAVHYYDGQVDFPERLVLETVLSAARAGADVANYVEAVAITRGADGRTVTGVTARDIHADQTFDISAKVVVNAAGPWVDDLGEAVGLGRQIGGTTGTHIVVDAFPGAPDACIYFEARADNRAILVIPWNGRYLIGTTDDRFEGDPGEVRGTVEEAAYLISETNLLIPEAALTVDDVLFSYTGVRPLPYRPGVKPGAIPRSHLLVTHPEAPQLVSVVGGKLTPHLSLGRQTVDIVAKLLKRTLGTSPAAGQQLPGAFAGAWDDAASAAAAVRASLPWRGAVAARLVKVYGARAAEIAALAASDPALAETIGEGRSEIPVAEVVFAIREEGATTLTDIVQRRTMVGLEPGLGLDVEHAVARAAAEELGWDDDRVAREIAEHHVYVTRLQGGVARYASAPAANDPGPGATGGSTDGATSKNDPASAAA